MFRGDGACAEVSDVIPTPTATLRAAREAGIEARKVAKPSAKLGVESWEKPLRKPVPTQR